ncbi:hypothetical protein NS44R_14580 [Mammaliicoccus sciuri]|nr:hypothetical protein NS44R_14580 [Mammaliicoccus sciuri]
MQHARMPPRRRRGSLHLGTDRRTLQPVIVIGLAQRAIGDRVGHELRGERRGQRMVERHRDRGDGLLEGLVQHARTRDLAGHRVELIARQREGIDPAALQEIEDLVIGLIARDLCVLEMRDRAAHRRGGVDGGDLDAVLVQRGETGDRRARLDDVGGVGNLIDRTERHLGLALGILGQEGDVPGVVRRRVGDLAGVLVHDIVDGHAELRRHRLAEIDGNTGIAVLRPGAPERAARRTDCDRDPELSGRRDLVFQGIGMS